MPLLWSFSGPSSANFERFWDPNLGPICYEMEEGIWSFFGKVVTHPLQGGVVVLSRASRTPLGHHF